VNITVTVDNAGPTATSEHPANNTYTNDATTLIYVLVTSTSGVDPNTIVMKVRGGDVTADATLTPITDGYNVSYTYPFGFEDETLVNVTLDATSYSDVAMDTYYWEFTVDLTNPAVSINAPQNNANISGTLLVNATVTDATAGVDTVQFNLTNASGGQALLTMVKEGATDYYYNDTFDTTTLVDGDYNITIIANDTAANINNTEYVTVTIDNTAPSVTITAPTPFLNTSSATNLLNVTVTDADSGVDTGSVYYIFENSTGSRMNASGAADVWTNIPLDASGYYNTSFSAEAGLADDDYAIFIKANDSIDIGADNQNSTEFVNITIDNTSPND
jgi:hypothetical protein